MTDFKAGQKVTVAGMRDPGEIISGPHAGFAADRWLVRKADGNVSLLPAKFLAPQDDKRGRYADIISVAIYGTPMEHRGPTMAEKLRAAADAIVAELDAPQAKSLAKGDKIRILANRYEGAKVLTGDVLTVQATDEDDDGQTFTTNAPRSSFSHEWYFSHSGEGTGWERV